MIKVLKSIEGYKITDTILVPTMVNMLVYHPEVTKYDLSSLRQINYGASPMPETVILKAMEVIPKCMFAHAYGQTECAPLLTVAGPECHVLEGPLAYKFKSTGKAVAGVELKIIDENSKEIKRGEVGEIAARGPNVMLGYWRQEELTKKAIQDGWMHTGDGGYMDEEGYIYIVDRVKDMIISGGENIYSAEVENAIYQLGGVVECAVIGIPDEQWGETPCAFVVLNQDTSATDKELITYAREKMAHFKAPRKIVFVDQLPKTATGKIQKYVLRQGQSSIGKQ